MNKYLLCLVFCGSALLAGCDDDDSAEQADCHGVVGGNGIVDICGVCDGDGSSCEGADCNGEIDGTAVLDSCGVCGGDDSSCQTSGTCASGQQTVIWEGAEWQRCDDGNPYDNDGAINYCAALELDGKTDWYLPSKDELKSLVVCTKWHTYTIKRQMLCHICVVIPI